MAGAAGGRGRQISRGTAIWQQRQAVLWRQRHKPHQWQLCGGPGMTVVLVAKIEPCPVRGAARSAALQTRDRSRLSADRHMPKLEGGGPARTAPPSAAKIGGIARWGRGGGLLRIRDTASRGSGPRFSFGPSLSHTALPDAQVGAPSGFFLSCWARLRKVRSPQLSPAFCSGKPRSMTGARGSMPGPSQVSRKCVPSVHLTPR